MDPRDENRRYLAGTWLAAVGVVVAAALFVATGVRGSSSSSVSTVVPVLALPVAFLIATQVIARRRIRRVYQMPDVESAVAALRDMAPLAQSDLVRVNQAAGAALVRGCYGDHAGAARELASVDWASRPPLFRAEERVARAILYYLADQPGPGLACAREAAVLADGTEGFPGAGQARDAVALAIRLGQCLMGTAGDDAVAFFEARRGRLTTPPRSLFVHWGLALAYDRAGRASDAAAARAVLREQAPRCAALHAAAQGAPAAAA